MNVFEGEGLLGDGSILARLPPRDVGTSVGAGSSAGVAAGVGVVPDATSSVHPPDGKVSGEGGLKAPVDGTTTTTTKQPHLKQPSAATEGPLHVIAPRSVPSIPPSSSTTGWTSMFVPSSLRPPRPPSSDIGQWGLPRTSYTVGGNQQGVPPPGITGLPTIAGLGESLILPLRGLLMLDASDAGNMGNGSPSHYTNNAIINGEGARGGEGGRGEGGSRVGAGAGIVYRASPSSELILSTGTGTSPRPTRGPTSDSGGNDTGRGTRSISACCGGVDGVDEGGRGPSTTRTVSLPARYKATHHLSSSSSPSSSSSSSSSEGHPSHPHRHHHHHHSSMFRSSDSVPGTWRDSLTGSYIPPHPNQPGSLSLSFLFSVLHI